MATKPHDSASGDAAERTNRPTTPDSAPDSATGTDENRELRDLEPRSVRKQFGQDVDVRPEPDQQDGVREWVDHSPGMKESFPEDGKAP